jgi:hypothetical protein
VNPLGLNLSLVGLDSGGVWSGYTAEDWVFSPNQVLAMTDATQSRQLSETLPLFRYSGALFVAVDVAIKGGVRFALDGSEPVCPGSAAEQQSGAFCFQPDRMMHVHGRSFRYGGKTRIVVYAREVESSSATQGWKEPQYSVDFPLGECSNLKAWACSNPGQDSGPQQVSILNISKALRQNRRLDLMAAPFEDDTTVGIDAILGPIELEPGPVVRSQFLVLTSLDSTDLQRLKDRLCAVVFDTPEGPSDRCAWQIWVDAEAGCNVEVWSDEVARWQPYNSSLFGSNVWTVSVTVLMESNSAASRARYLITKEMNTEAFVRTFHLATTLGQSQPRGLRADQLVDLKLNFAHVVAPRPAEKRTATSLYGCTSHYECGAGLFCSTSALRSFSADRKIFLGSGDITGRSAGCDLCAVCWSGTQSGTFDLGPFDLSCPEDKCGPRMGVIPQCWNGQKVLEAVEGTCADSHPLNLSRFQAPKLTESGGAATSGLLRARFLTQFNRLVGSVVVRQRRVAMPSATGSKVCGFRDDSIAEFSRTADASLGLICHGDQRDSSPFGTDPVFAVSSTLYDGKMDPTKHYNLSVEARISNANARAPFGFFPHSYDWKTCDRKTSHLVQEDADNFLLFFDERVSNRQAMKMLQYIQDGNFIDLQTKELSVEIITLNAMMQIFCKCVVTFSWRVS